MPGKDLREISRVEFRTLCTEMSLFFLLLSSDFAMSQIVLKFDRSWLGADILRSQTSICPNSWNSGNSFRSQAVCRPELVLGGSRRMIYEPCSIGSAFLPLFQLTGPLLVIWQGLCPCASVQSLLIASGSLQSPS